MTDLEALKSNVDDAIGAYINAAHAANESDQDGMILGWVIVAEVTSPTMDTEGRYALALIKPDTQRPPYTRGLLHEALSDLDTSDGSYDD